MSASLRNWFRAPILFNLACQMEPVPGTKMTNRNSGMPGWKMRRLMCLRIDCCMTEAPGTPARVCYHDRLQSDERCCFPFGVVF